MFPGKVSDFAYKCQKVIGNSKESYSLKYVSFNKSALESLGDQTKAVTGFSVLTTIRHDKAAG